jgi:hypothetical protein
MAAWKNIGAEGYGGAVVECGGVFDRGTHDHEGLHSF